MKKFYTAEQLDRVYGRLLALKAQGTPASVIVSTLNKEGFRTANKKPITPIWVYTNLPKAEKRMKNKASEAPVAAAAPATAAPAPTSASPTANGAVYVADWSLVRAIVTRTDLSAQKKVDILSILI